jgi:hypothetical protein
MGAKFAGAVGSQEDPFQVLIGYRLAPAQGERKIAVSGPVIAIEHQPIGRKKQVASLVEIDGLG